MIKLQCLRDQIYAHLRGNINRGALKPGAPINPTATLHSLYFLAIAIRFLR